MGNRLLRNKKWLAASSALLVAGAAVSFAGSASAAVKHAPANVTHIVFWYGHSSGQLHLAVEAEVKQFNATHPTIAVQPLVVHATNKGVAAFLAHKAPNVAMITTAEAQKFVSAGAVMNLKPFLAGKSGLTAAQIRADYYPAVWQDMQAAGGKQYMMPLEKKSSIVLYYNEDLFKKAHIAAPPKTWEQLVADAFKINALGKTYHGIEWTPSVRQFFVMTMDFGGSVWTNAAKTQFNLNNAGAIKAFAMLRNMVANHVLIPTSGYNYQLDFGTGHVGLLIDASAGYTYDLASVGGKFPMLAASAPFGPAGRNYNYINGASLVMFNQGTAAQRQAAWTFMKWMSGPQNNTYWNEHTNYLPLGPAGMRMMKPFYAKNPAWAASYSNPSYWMIKPVNPNYDSAKTAMMSDFMKGLLGQESIQTALANMTKDGNTYMSGQQRL